MMNGVMQGTSVTPGFWSSTTGDEFYVSTDQAYVNRFAIYVNVTNCGSYTTLKITRITSVPITNKSFSFTGSFYATGTFDTATSAHGTDGLNNYFSTTCQRTFNGGPWSWTATWKNSSQPALASSVATEEIVEPTQVPADAHIITAVP